ncbi:alpha-ketoglutarate-dependent dioxygenase alkB homolog 3 [Syngnathus scovelli]|uniref:alpha-ketoglutarate-dependent dioxygenase alkB homolog 3 n=1 Tax=Syngnathus scovelli TaxID=161590 RepID=UPI00210F33B3|nr:alpha-ketoglutarate-dependent dioxygenase alkB homolog 3 [Syngnathus scovelli]XP_049579704.1 alpha-ketoglutarate-dependent dioxygenase alkB homolog 3 [Syngnathus scovelli]XP_049579705.1 alpha-ketoglutarate-dependent dioxygenase alkB homolog 3 [Syngnathus scovelli]XP_049579707.1 alpha-ketoglutarate-dependent dioxygenase alkB homolog 3 [Syngnathus scovelli]XP_049579708.1 alpha-ketoglutarate-dependent dioxygenase alkB homolog 3 [Syngnathus scovelli]XP_049579709.1 alpha-ketoglutarate-dependent 
MADKRQRARVQGSWAKQLPKPQRPAAPQSQSANAVSASWGIHRQTTSGNVEFQQPIKQVRDVPSEKVIDQAGDYEISHGPSGVSRLRLVPRFLPAEEADWMFAKLLAELPWSQKTNFRQDEAYEEPRLTCWFGELPYTYARSTMAANTKWHPLLLKLRRAVSEASGGRGGDERFNSLLCNLYRDGHDSIGWHSDDEASLGRQPVIASLSLGDSRVFSLRKKPPLEENGDFTYVERIKVPLGHGALLLMEGATQDDWQHQVAKEYHDRGPRINLTFRSIFPEPQGHRPGTKLHFTDRQTDMNATN